MCNCLESRLAFVPRVVLHVKSTVSSVVIECLIPGVFRLRFLVKIAVGKGRRPFEVLFGCAQAPPSAIHIGIGFDELVLNLAAHSLIALGNMRSHHLTFSLGFP